jgi:predicted HTH transcriptional regulator
MPSRTDDKTSSMQFSEKAKSEMSFRKTAQNDAFPKDSRKSSIIELLKKQPNLTIKDITKVIPDCSAKTIQRELSVLVHSGMIKKEGNRRWSRYSLK